MADTLVQQPIPSQDSTPPTVNVILSPISQSNYIHKKKGGLIAGIALTVLSTVLGSLWWTQNKSTPTTIALVTEAECNRDCSPPNVCIHDIKTDEYKCRKTGGQDPCNHTICPINYYCVQSGGGDDSYCEPKDGGRPPGEPLTCPPGSHSNGQCENGVIKPPCCVADSSPSPSPSPTMACTGLTQSPSTTPVIGTKLTFTCTGSISPVNSGSLSYKFRYSINNGTLTTLANKTATTAELTIASCGSYLVECQACATLGGITKCDPTWTGATQ